ncbi:MAG: Ig-like domain-containing protein, partial [Deltaproteobacteria bacterium]
AVSVRRLNSLLDDARNRVNIVVLDACRNNPIPSMGRSGARGLTVASLAPAESIIMYSTGAGQIAQDGNGNRNSPFAQAFLKYIAQGGDITATIKAITAETKRLTSGAQIPYLYSSLTRDFAMNSKTQAASANTYENSEQRKAPTISITREYGSLEVRAEKAGQLYLDGVKIVDIAERIKVTLNDIEVGNRTLEIRYKDGEKEQRNVAVAKERTAIIYFAFQRTKIPAVTISGMTLNRNPMAFTISTAPNPPSQTAQLIAEVSPSEASQKVSWTSSNPTAATVSSSGVVTAISVGSAKITAMASDNKTTADCFVTIWQIDENGFVRYYCNDAACYGHAIGMGSLGSANNTRLTATAANPFAFQVKKVSGSSGQGYGIQFCGNGRTSYYRFTIATNGQYRFQKSVEGKMTDLVHWTNSNAIIRGDNKVNTISTWQPAAGEISISINGTIVIDKFSDSTFSTGFLSVYASNASPNSSIPDNFPAIPEDIRYKVTSPFAYPSLSND